MSTETKAPAPSRTRWSRTPTGMAAAAAGVLTSFGFAPVGIEPAGIAGIALLLAVLRAPSVRSARWRFTTVVGMLFAAGFMGPLLWWMNAVSFGAYLVLVIAQAVLVTASVFAVRAVIGFRGWPIWTACVWVGFEYLRSSLPFGGFPWGRLAYVVVDTPLESYARLVGTPSTSFVVFLTAALAACLLASTSIRGRLGSLSAIGVVFAVGVILPTGISGSAGYRTVAVVQGDVPVLFAPWPSGEIFQMHLEETQRLADAIDAGDEPAPDLILWPENSLDIDPYKDPGVSDRIEDMSRRLGAPILIGAILDGPTRGTAYNAGIVWSEDGPESAWL